MGTVNATIAGRQFRLACEDGQEEHLQGLAHDIDQRIINLRARFGEIGDTRLTVMAALMVADELEARMRASSPPTAPRRPPMPWSAPSIRRPSGSRALPASSTRRCRRGTASASADHRFVHLRLLICDKYFLSSLLGVAEPLPIREPARHELHLFPGQARPQ